MAEPRAPHTRETLRAMFDAFIAQYEAAVEQALHFRRAHINPMHARRAVAIFLRTHSMLAVDAIRAAGFCTVDFRAGAGRKLPFVFEFALDDDCCRLRWLRFDAGAMWTAFSPALRCVDSE